LPLLQKRLFLTTGSRKALLKPESRRSSLNDIGGFLREAVEVLLLRIAQRVGLPAAPRFVIAQHPSQLLIERLLLEGFGGYQPTVRIQHVMGVAANFRDQQR